MKAAGEISVDTMDRVGVSIRADLEELVIVDHPKRSFCECIGVESRMS